MLGGVVRISNGVRSSGAVKRLFGSSTTLRSANPTGPDVQKCCEIYVSKAKVIEISVVRVALATDCRLHLINHTY